VPAAEPCEDLLADRSAFGAVRLDQVMVEHLLGAR
jgi:hypothetical protein